MQIIRSRGNGICISLTRHSFFTPSRFGEGYTVFFFFFRTILVLIEIFVFYEHV